MKNKLKIGILILIICIVSFLVGCANGKAGGENINLTIEEIYANNQVDAVLQSHSTMAYREQSYYTNGSNPDYIIEMQYYREDGYLRTDFMSYDERDNKKVYAVDYEDGCSGGATFCVTNKDEKFMTILPAENYEKGITDQWFSRSTDLPVSSYSNYTETIDSTYMQDGYIVATTLTKYRDDDSSYMRTKYVMEPEHGHVVYMEECHYDLEHGQTIPDVEYSMETNEVISRKETSIFYDERWNFYQVDPRKEIIGQQEDYCELTVTEYNESGEPVTRVFPVAHGTDVNFYSLGDYRVYYDEELTEELSMYEIVDTSGDAVKVFMAKR